MKTFSFIVVIVLMLEGVCFAGDRDFEIRTKYYDPNPGDGFLEAGTFQNPYVIVGGPVDVTESSEPQESIYDRALQHVLLGD